MLYLPILILVIFSFNANSVVGVWTGLSTRWYEELLRDRALIDAFQVSLWVAFWSTLISTVLGTLGAMALERFRFRGKLTYDEMCIRDSCKGVCPCWPPTRGTRCVWGSR